MNEWVVAIITQLGYGGIAALMLLENLFPPIPSELIMPMAGFAIAEGKMQALPVVVAGTLGTLLGALPWYYAGWVLGAERLQNWADRYGRWLTISRQEVNHSLNWFDRYGIRAVFLCRLVPGIRTLISLPAGVYRMPWGLFLLYSTLGILIWTSFLTWLGYILGANYAQIEVYIGPVAKIILLLGLVGFGAWVIRRQRLRRTARKK
ncbi:Alkaline phosphatase-like protein [Gloeomargarita lithophora Alchichica-D10]|uniref:Alkaline phosphatase-like protein n=1 Tax=Gloeomargarita lithophora Alchichica-D10 TaxID=1188229 RepID=A0A1J0AA40_9CYAN|nr:DedA family protein [Gloeomargarita lithophora]APB32795.1 Alkaline phosphatase-like protein [Gloeomargarita lithophora Alchichica-D10]